MLLTDEFVVTLGQIAGRAGLGVENVTGMTPQGLLEEAATGGFAIEVKPGCLYLSKRKASLRVGDKNLTRFLEPVWRGFEARAKFATQRLKELERERKKEGWTGTIREQHAHRNVLPGFIVLTIAERGKDRIWIYEFLLPAGLCRHACTISWAVDTAPVQ